MVGKTKIPYNLGCIVDFDHSVGEVRSMSLFEQSWKPPARFPGLCNLFQALLNGLGNVLEIFQKTDSYSTINLVSLFLAGKVMDRAVEWCSGRRDDAGIASEAGSTEDVRLISGAARAGISCRN